MKKTIVIAFSIFINVMANAQNVGIGETNPTESKLQVKTTDSAAFLIQNTGTAIGTKTALFYKTESFYSGSIATVKTATQSYRLGMYTFGGSLASSLKERLSILDNGNVGIGTIIPNAKLEVAGSFKLVNGTQGADRVLTSDAAGNATWVAQAPAAFNNIERFQYEIRGFSSNPIAFSTGYNYGTSTTTYTAGESNFKINISKSGLYHFDVNFNHAVAGDLSITGTNPVTNEITIQTGSKTLYGYVPFYALPNSTASASSYDKSFDVYINAPTFFYVGCTKKASNIGYSILVTGHLISE